MKTNQTFLILVLLIFELTQAQNVNIPNADFKEFLLDKTAKDLLGNTIDIDTNKDGELQVSEAENISDINLSYSEASSMAGLESFVNLTYLFCTNNKNLTSLDISGLTKLETLHCKTNQKLETLTLGNLAQLNNFTCSYNDKITSLDLSGLNALTIFEIAGSAMTSLDITSLNNITNFGCLNTDNLTSVNLSGLTKLKSIDFNGNKKITSLDLSSLTNLNRFYGWNNTKLTDLSITGLINLTELNIQSNNALTQLDLGDLTQLNKFWCQYNPLLAAIKFNGQVNLKEVNLKGNISLMNVDLSSLTNLDDFICWGNNALTNLNLSMSTALTKLDVQGNSGLQTIDVSNLKKLDDFECKNNVLLSNFKTVGTELNYLYFEQNNGFVDLNLSDFTRLNELYCSENIALISLNLSELPSLQRLTCSANNTLTNLNIRNGSVLEYISLSDLPNIKHICIDGAELNQIKTAINQAQINAEINTYCSFEPGGKFNTISGILSFDEEGDGCGVDEGVLDIKIKIDNGTSYKFVYTKPSGAFNYYNKNAGTYTVTPQFDNPYFTSSPASKEIVFAGGDASVTQNFCITAPSNKNDLEIKIIPIEGARPGFDAKYNLVYSNIGTTTLSGAVEFTYDDAVSDFVSASETPIKKTGKLTFNYSGLKPFESRSIAVVLNINSPMEQPAVNGGDKLTYTATIDPTENDENKKDNTFTLSDNVVNSFDPNDKTCLQGTSITPEMVGEFVDYLIRFENTGTAEAINIVVKDIIDTTVFDINTLTVIDASHNYELRITDTNKVEFIFEGINLPFPPSELRHGYIAFKIKTKSTVALGDQLKNKADIYFDFNFPIITNEYVTTVEKPLSTKTFNLNNQVDISFYPNPATDVITFKEAVQSVQVYNSTGKLLRHAIINGTEFNISELVKGTYVLKIKTNKGVAVEKLVKQ